MAVHRMKPRNTEEVVTRDGVEAVVYLYTTPHGKPAAIMYGGKRSMPDRHNAYYSAEQRARDVDAFLTNLAKWDAIKAAERAGRATFCHGFNVGDVLHYSWGYGQTNVDFYQVTRTTDKSIWMREIAQASVPGTEGYMSEQRVARPGVFIDDAPTMRKTPQPSSDGTGYVRMDHGVATLWDGKPQYCSWYH